MLSQRLLGQELPDPSLFDERLAPDLLRDRLKCVSKLLDSHLGYRDLKMKSSHKLKRAQHDYKMLEKKCEILQSELEKMQRESQNFKLKAKESDQALAD